MVTVILVNQVFVLVSFPQVYITFIFLYVPLQSQNGYLRWSQKNHCTKCVFHYL
jgi:hypothetical protein